MSFCYRAGWILFRGIFWLYFRWRIYGSENVPREGPVILAANHCSFLDPPLIGSALPRPINYLARESLFRFPLIGALLRAWNGVPVDRDGGGAKGLKTILDRLFQGAGIILFPEGTRTLDGQLQEPKAGIGLIVIKSTTPVVPVRVVGTFEAYGKNHWIPRPRPIAVIYGKPMFFEELRTEAKCCSKSRLREIYMEVANRLMQEIGRLKTLET